MKQTGDHIKIMRKCYKNLQIIKMHFTMAVKAIIVLEKTLGPAALLKIKPNTGVFL